MVVSESREIWSVKIMNSGENSGQEGKLVQSEKKCAGSSQC